MNIGIVAKSRKPAVIFDLHPTLLRSRKPKTARQPKSSPNPTSAKIAGYSRFAGSGQALKSREKISSIGERQRTYSSLFSKFRGKSSNPRTESSTQGVKTQSGTFHNKPGREPNPIRTKKLQELPPQNCSKTPAELLQNRFRHTAPPPKNNPLPPEFHVPVNPLCSPRKRTLLMISLSLAAAVLLASFAPSPTDPAPTESASPDGMSGSTTAGGHKIEIVGTANVKNMESVVVVRRDLAFPMFGDTNFQQFGDGANFIIQGGNAAGAAGGGGGGFAAAGGAGGGGGNAGGPPGEPISPNFGIALRITPEKAAGKRRPRTIVNLEPGASIVEQDGQTVNTPAGSLQVACTEFEQQFPDCRYLYAERQQNPNRC